MLHPLPDRYFQYLPWFNGNGLVTAEGHILVFQDCTYCIAVESDDVFMRLFVHSLGVMLNTGLDITSQINCDWGRVP
jgi:hypothetical protein